MSIPWTVETRPDTRQYNGRLGMWLFIAADAMFMGALYSSLVFLRTAADAWPADGGALPLGSALLTTVLVILTAATLRWGKRRGTILGLVGAALLGGATVAVMTGEQNAVIAAGGTVSSENFYATYTLLAGAIRVQAAGAVVYAVWLLIVNAGMRRSDPQRFQNRVECLSLFWGFITVAWIIAFAMFHIF